VDVWVYMLPPFWMYSKVGGTVKLGAQYFPDTLAKSCELSQRHDWEEKKKRIFTPV